MNVCPEIELKTATGLAKPFLRHYRFLEKAQGATRLGATELRASEREICSERVSERTSETSEKSLKKTLKTPPSQRPSQRQRSLSEALGPVAPAIYPLNSFQASCRKDPVACRFIRGPAAILFISRDTCSDSIAKIFRACFCGVSHNYRAIRCKMGYRTDVSV